MSTDYTFRGNRSFRRYKGGPRRAGALISRGQDSHEFTTLKSHLIEFLFRRTSLEFFGIQFNSAFARHLNSSRHKRPTHKRTCKYLIYQIVSPFSHPISPPNLPPPFFFGCRRLYPFCVSYYIISMNPRMKWGYLGEIYTFLSRPDLVCLEKSHREAIQRQAAHHTPTPTPGATPDPIVPL